VIAQRASDDFAVWITSDDDGRPVARMLGAVVPPEDPVPPLPAGVSHLLVANDALIRGRWGVHSTLCGREVRGPGAAREEHECQMSCDCVRFCPDCAKEAVRWSAGVSDRRPRPGSTAQE
jgi:hypothetical protein